MRGERYVLLGLARARSEWFRSVALWATASAIPAEFSKCVSAEELRTRLQSGRSFSAALLDGTLPATDRDLIAAVREAGCVPIVVDDDHGRDWTSIGAAVVLPSKVGLEDLLDALAAHATMVRSGDAAPTLDVGILQPVTDPTPLVVVCGPGGTGASSVAIALAQGLAEPAYRAVPDGGGPVLLADFCRWADLAMLHDARDVVPGVQELVELHRGRRPSTPEVQAQTFHVTERGYHLLLGLRRPRYWSALRSRSFEAALSSLRQAFAAVVCDVEPDLEGEEDGGSLDVEERNLMARTAVGQADGVFVVGRPDMPGLHGLVRLIGDLVAFGVPESRIVPVLNQTPRRPRLRAELTRAFHDLVGPVIDASGAPSPTPAREAAHLPPLFLPARRVNEALRDGVPLPSPLPAILVGVYRALLGARADGLPAVTQPVPVAPGSVGALTRQEVPRR
ncbi:MAG: hypothetical protein ACRDYX_06470 [Egibacteraceae bacterium]